MNITKIDYCCKWLRTNFRSQHIQILEGGFAILLQKICTITSIMLAMPLVIMVRLLSPLVLIRFGKLRSERIGHFAGNTELYLCENDERIRDKKIIDVFSCSLIGNKLNICNQQLRKMWKRTLHIYEFTAYLDRANRILPGGKRHIVEMVHDRDVYGLYARTRKHLLFTPEEEQLGRESLKNMGIPDDADFACIYERDSAYLDETLTSPNKKDGRSDQDYRNGNILNYIPAAEDLVRRGYYVIRLGAVVNSQLHSSNPKIIDYATNGSRTDFLDIYLPAKCGLFFGAPSGIEAISRICRRPIAYVNQIPFGNVQSYIPNCISIFKKFWILKENRFMTFREILDSNVATYYHIKQYEEFGLKIVENSPEEIKALAIEMVERMKGTWRSTGEDEKLQDLFWLLFKNRQLISKFGRPLHASITSRIGADFLRQNRGLLD